jgi:beta-galactosidase
MTLAPLPSTEPRKKILFDFGWRFHRGEALGAERPGYDDRGWRTVDLPHDWSIEDIPAEERTPFLRFTEGTWKFRAGDNLAWKNPGLDDKGWKTVQAPADWREYGHKKKNAWGWFRRELVLPAGLIDRDFVLDLGLVAEVCEAFVNGRSIGRTGTFPPKYKAPNWWMPLSQFLVKAAWLNPDGGDVVALRVFSKMGKPLPHCGLGKGGLWQGSPEGDAKGPFDFLSPSNWATGYTVGGRGWYRKTFQVPSSWKGKRLHLNFDGVYMDSRVWFNGKLVAEHPYGYTPFDFELPEPKWGAANTVTVQVRNDGFNSRWYTGSGIYRHVHLTVSDPVHVAHRGISIRTSGTRRTLVDLGVDVKAEVRTEVTIRTSLFDPQGRKVAEKETEVVCPAGNKAFQQTLVLDQPALWSADEPNLHSALIQLWVDGRLKDAQSLRFGVRDLVFNARVGFLCNGRKTVLRGGCMHHDNGILGSRAFDAAEERRIRVMKENGFNAVRTSHNPPSEAFLDACDRLGFFVLDEAFDQWQDKTNEKDYHRFHAKWWKKDLEALVLRDRNHPSVIMWSIGNEISSKEKPATVELARQQAGFVRSLDPSRPVTEGVNGSDKQWVSFDPYMKAHDVPGYNYMERWYRRDHERVPGRVTYQSESSSQRIFESCFETQEMPWVIGDFVWTGYDYIGEASIGWHSFDLSKRENRMWTTAHCGDLDLCGHARPQNHYRQVMWGTGPALALAVHSPFPSFGPRVAGSWSYDDVQPHWNWAGYEGKKLAVDVYTQCDRVELRLNGRKIGTAKSDKATKFKASFKVPYQPGRLMAVGYREGKKAGEAVLQTAGKPVALRLRSEKALVDADGQSLLFAHVDVVDGSGRRVPTADNLLAVETSGAAERVAFGTAHPQNLDSFADAEHRAYEGRALLVFRAGAKKGGLRVKVSSAGLKSATLSSLRVG